MIIKNLLLFTVIPESGGSNPSKETLCEGNIGQEIWCRKVGFTGLRTIRTV
jgi:hypothetical protein